MNKISLPTEYTQEIASGMEAGGGIQLPFSVCYGWVVNGKSELKQLGGVAYFGGWNFRRTEVDDYIAETQNEIPSYFKPVERETETETILSYESRYIMVAPIAFRQSWITENKQRFDHYVEGGRPHAQVLCYLLDYRKDEHGNPIYPGFGPIVISGKGYQARNIRDAFAAWEKYTAPLRREIAPGVSSYFFAVCLGTFGDKPNFVQVGGQAKSTITPIVAWLPENLTAGTLAKLFVGETVAATMVDFKQQAVDWLSAWKGTGQDQMPSKYADNGANNAPENFPPDNEPF
jgi:hypothetical protein